MKTHTELSPRGRQRRIAMLPHIQKTLITARRRRRVTATGGTLLFVALAGFIGWGAWNQIQHSVDNDDVLAADTRPSHDFERQALASDVSSKLVTFELIDDQQLLAMLETVGQPSALAQIDGKLVVLPIRKRQVD